MPSLPPLLPRTVSPSKRNRSSTQNEPRLPPARRSRPPPLPASNAFLFKGIHPLFSRHALAEDHELMEVRCGQVGCKDYPYKETSRRLNSTNNYKAHYKKFHPEIALTERDQEAKKKAKEIRALREGHGFFSKPVNDRTQEQQYRVLLLEFIIKNNLSFQIVDKPETKALITFLNPKVKQITRATLGRDLKARYEEAETGTRNKLQKHIQSGGRIALTTDGWAGNNKADYIAVTAHLESLEFEADSFLLDIIELTAPVHDGVYLNQKLIEVTDRLGITNYIISVTRDNASPNDTMLQEFQTSVALRLDELEGREKVFAMLKFDRKEGDVRCCAHIYNIAVQTGKLYIVT
jgi:hypothetical protein